uniref:Uncharacterized protein n=1 Tax=Oncorhynchus tshawytscha TaxID=74940 RepID=A0AAZ3P507_ONCTS
ITFWLITFFISISSIFQVHSTSQCIDTLRSNNINSTSTCALECEGTLLTTAELDKCGKTLVACSECGQALQRSLGNTRIWRKTSGFLEEDERGDVDSENEMGVYNDDSAINKVKHYRGFLCTFGPKTMRREQGSREELQKRYGGFMRRNRPKLKNLKWDNQRERVAFYVVRSDEEPSSYDDFGL